ncbi:MAG TPA: VPDSG-CTERM sorting domain-containing protein [Vicinamibacterales bacterium]|nr:VPDSG-CTERM sorting domain-containing protein [Vicinamibacterales bacterium]
MRISNFKTLLAVIAISFLTVPAYALSLTDPGVVGVANGAVAPQAFGAPSTLLAAAQHLLDMAANTADPTGCTIAPQGTSCYRTGPTEYSADLSSLTSTKVENLTGVPQNVAGYEWVLAKYDGPNAGYVLFHVPTYGSTIPGLSAPIWTNTSGNGYGISGYMAWGSTTRVPDSGTTLSLLGLALAGIGAFRRFKA